MPSEPPLRVLTQSEWPLYVACKLVVKNDNLPCLCGTHDYDDVSNPCPKCCCAIAIETCNEFRRDDCKAAKRKD